MGFQVSPGAEARIFRKDYINGAATDVLALHLVKPSADMLFTKWVEYSLVSYEEGFKIPTKLQTTI